MAAVSVSVLRPGILLMRRIRLPAKLLLMGVMLLVPLLLLIGSIYRGASAVINLKGFVIARTFDVF